MSIRDSYQRRVSVAAVDVGTGEYVEFNQDNTSYFDMAQASLSSGSIPGVFPPQHFKGHVLMDGGTVWDVNVSSAVRQCQEMGAANEDITVDVLICDTIPQPSLHDQVTIQNFATARSIGKVYANFNSIAAEMAAADGVNLRYYFEYTKEEDCKPNLLNFNGDETWCLQL